MHQLLEKFENKRPEIIFEWQDQETNAKGWIVINSLRGGAAAGGTRMHSNVTKEEVVALAKTMEVKFTISGPAIGGAKSGINFDPNDPRKDGVLNRWFKATKPLLKNFYGTGGDMNIDEVEDVIPKCKENGILFPLEGVVIGHFKKDIAGTTKIINQLSSGVPLIVESENINPNTKKRYSVGDLITGYGVAESVLHYYNIYHKNTNNKRAIIQGWGNVAGATAYYLAKSGISIVGIIDKVGGLINTEGFSVNEIELLLEKRTKNFLESDNLLSFNEINNEIWSIGAEIFIPAAASRLITKDQLDKLIENGLEVISAGANVPFADKEIFFGPISKYADNNVSVIPDFISNCGMARAFSYLMEDDAKIQDIAIFEAVSDTIKKALLDISLIDNKKTHLSTKAFEIALNKLL